MGYASDATATILKRPITSVEAEARHEESRTLTAPQATPDGKIVEKPTPAAAPIQAFQAQPATWD